MIGDVLVLGTRGDDLADVLASVLAPIPHKERVRAVIGDPLTIHLYVARVGRELFFIFLAERERVVRLGEQPVEELDIARVELRVELVIAGMAENQNATLAQEGFAPEKIEEITRAHDLNE